MADVANEAQVSQTSVSLVLNFAEGARLSPQTRERVINAARKLGYQPVRRGKMASGTSTYRFLLRRNLDRPLGGRRAQWGQ